MGGVFSQGSSKQSHQRSTQPPAITNVDRAVLDLKNARDRLHRYRTQLEKDDAKLIQQARLARDNGNTQRALGLMRLRKYKQSQATACEEQLLNVLKMVETIGSTQNDAAVLSALAAGKDALKKMHEETTVEDVLNLMDAIREEHDVEQEITTILSGVPTLSPADEEAVEAEWQAMAMEITGIDSLPIAPTDKPVHLPEAPTGNLDIADQQPARVAIPG